MDEVSDRLARINPTEQLSKRELVERIRGLESDAEVGQLLRAVRERWPHDQVCIETLDDGWSLVMLEDYVSELNRSAIGKTDAEALRALLGEG